MPFCHVCFKGPHRMPLQISASIHPFSGNCSLFLIRVTLGEGVYRRIGIHSERQEYTPDSSPAYCRAHTFAHAITLWGSLEFPVCLMCGKCHMDTGKTCLLHTKGPLSLLSIPKPVLLQAKCTLNLSVFLN